jgi:CRISPR-associated endoribonuclease Cas6
MRYKFRLKLAGEPHIAHNYHASLGDAVYKLLRFDGDEFLSDEVAKPALADGERYEHYSYALRFSEVAPQRDGLKLKNPYAALIFSAPGVEEYIAGLSERLEGERLEIFADGIRTEFEISKVEPIRDPQIKRIDSYTLLSPMVLALPEDPNQRYLRHNDDPGLINEAFNESLRRKFEIVNGEKYDGDSARLYWDQKYISKRLKRGKKTTKKIRISRNGSAPEEIVALEIPFTVEGDPELIRAGYLAGFGVKNNLGFGLAEKKRSR